MTHTCETNDIGDCVTYGYPPGSLGHEMANMDARMAALISEIETSAKGGRLGRRVARRMAKRMAAPFYTQQEYLRELIRAEQEAAVARFLSS